MPADADVAAAVAAIKAELGPKGWLSAPEDIAPHLVERRGLWRGATQLVVRPADTAETAAVVRICAAAGLAIVPQGGNTGLCGGGVPGEDGRNIVLDTGRMRRIRALDADGYSMVAEAGCILAELQAAAAAADRLFPLSLGAEGSCTIGGNISTNAGGIQVLRYGNTRELVLGLEVVLPDGTIWDGLRALCKNNTGYDLKQLFIGAEGTLGIITAASLRLFPRPIDIATALVGLHDLRQAMTLLGRVRSGASDLLTAAELMPRIGIDFATRHIPGARDPLSTAHPWYLLLEMSGSAALGETAAMLDQILGACLEAGLLADAAVARSAAQRADFWRLREGLVEAQKFEGGSIKHDISVPLTAVADFIETASAAVEVRLPGIRPVPFGHAGDGNIHFNLSQPVGADREQFLGRWREFNDIVHPIAASLGGSISAEHGLGRLKNEEIARYKSPLEITLMRRVKQAFDPQGIMNPGKVLPGFTAAIG